MHNIDQRECHFAQVLDESNPLTANASCVSSFGVAGRDGHAVSPDVFEMLETRLRG